MVSDTYLVPQKCYFLFTDQYQQTLEYYIVQTTLYSRDQNNLNLLIINNQSSGCTDYLIDTHCGVLIDTGLIVLTGY